MASRKIDSINNFYSTTGKWWGPAESTIKDRDYDRVKLLQKICGDGKSVLELGSGYGNTAALAADAGYDVVANDLSERIKFSQKFAEQNHKGSLRFVQGDFYEADLGKDYDVVAYWNGFGIGSDSDQRRLLRRIASDWIKPSGKVLIDIGNPFVRASWAGEEERRDANPERGYRYDVGERTDYDPVQNRFLDTWWESSKPDDKITQSLRNYSPADLLLLLESTGLALDAIFVNGREIDPSADHAGNSSLLKDEQEYLAVLVKS